jgi:hypothetical protein
MRNPLSASLFVSVARIASLLFGALGNLDLFCSRDTESRARGPTLGRSNLGWQTAQAITRCTSGRYHRDTQTRDQIDVLVKAAAAPARACRVSTMAPREPGARHAREITGKRISLSRARRFALSLVMLVLSIPDLNTGLLL